MNSSFFTDAPIIRYADPIIGNVEIVMRGIAVHAQNQYP